MKKSCFFKFFVFALVSAIVFLPSCKDYDDDISRLDKELGDAKTELTGSIASQLAALKTELNTSVDNKVKTVADDLAASKSKLAALEANSATKAQLDAVKAEILQQVVTLEVLEDLQADYDSEIAAILARIATLEEDGATKEDLEALKEEIYEEINALNAAVEILDLEVEGLDSTVQALSSKVDADKVEVLAKISEVEAELGTKVAALEALLDIVDGKSTVLDGIAEQLADHLARIAANETAIEGLIADLEELTGRVDVVEADITAINERIDDLEEELGAKIASLFTLAKNRLTAITLAPNAYVDGVEAVKFSSLTYRPMVADENALVLNTYNMSIGAPAVASYKFNPRTFVLGNADYNYVDRRAEIITTRAASNFVAIEGAPVYKAADGTVNFTLRRLNAHSTQAPADKENFIGLEATLKGDALAEGETGVVVAAPQELVYDELITPFDLFISDKATLATAGDDAHYPVTFDAAKAGKVWYTDMTYDKIYNLKEKVATCLETATHKAFNIEDYNLSYKFSVASSDYDIVEGGTTTNQQEWIELVDANEGTFKAEDFNKEAIGRRPILKVELVDLAGNVVRRAFVKVEITVKKTEDILVGKSAYDLVLACEGTKAKYELDEMFIRENVYRVISNTQGQTSLSHEEFWNLYDATTAVTKVTKNNVVLPGISQPTIVDGATGVGTATKKIVWAFDHSEVGSVGAAGSQLVATLTVKNKLSSSEYPEHVTFRFVVNVTNPTFTLDKVENAIYWKNNMYQVNIAVPNSPQSPASAAVFSTNLPQAYSTYDVEFTPDVTECVSSEFVVVKTFANGEETMVGNVSTPLPGVGISGNNITLDKSGPYSTAVKTALNSEGGLQAVVQHVYTFANGDKVVVNEFMVNFIRPVTLNTQAPVSVTDAIDNGDVADFQWAGLLTDWRGNAIIAPELVPTQACWRWWQFDHIMEYEYVPGYQRIVTPADIEVTYGEVSFTTGGPTTMYEGTAAWRIERRIWWEVNWETNPGTGNTGTLETGVSMLTVSDVLLFLETLEAGINVPSNTWQYEYRLVVEVPVITSVTVPGGQLVEYTYVQSIDYTPAVYEDVPGKWIPKAYEPTDYPNVDGTADGERNGDWVWHELCFPWANYVPGQYWDFYGPIGQLTAHFDQVTTSLTYNGGQLPVNVTLTQVGNTVKYVNVGAPISESYEIYIPATITYGWGTLETVLTIVVVPAV